MFLFQDRQDHQSCKRQDDGGLEVIATIAPLFSHMMVNEFDVFLKLLWQSTAMRGYAAQIYDRG
jgi:hypothetical protein